MATHPHLAMTPKIQSIFAHEILDSRGYPTVEAWVTLDNGDQGRAAVPSGASTGEHEALELRDGNPLLKAANAPYFNETRYLGKGVQQAVENVNHTIALKLKGESPFDQAAVDQLLIDLDGTPNKSRLGANAILAVSLATAKAAALALKLPFYQYLGGIEAHTLPVPLMNILNGGAHSDAPVDIQEFMIVPKKAQSFRQALQMGAEIYHHLKGSLKSQKLSTGIGDEGGFAPQLPSNEGALEQIALAVQKSGYKLGEDIFFALDVAASEFYDSKDQVYVFKKSTGERFRAEELIAYYQKLQSKYPIISIEDGCDQNDWSGWKALTKAMGHNTQIVGDDLFVTNPKFLQKGFAEGAANALLVKFNQIGTLSETQHAVRLAHLHGYKTIASHRSGETEDATLAHLAVGLQIPQIKTGAPCRSDRNAKYNELLRIEATLGPKAIYAGNRG
jgi:enolase